MFGGSFILRVMQFVSFRGGNCLFLNIMLKCRCRMVGLGFEGRKERGVRTMGVGKDKCVS